MWACRMGQSNPVQHRSLTILGLLSALSLARSQKTRRHPYTAIDAYQGIRWADVWQSLSDHVELLVQALKASGRTSSSTCQQSCNTKPLGVAWKHSRIWTCPEGLIWQIAGHGAMMSAFICLQHMTQSNTNMRPCHQCMCRAQHIYSKVSPMFDTLVHGYPYYHCAHPCSNW